jgi:hypothetical protein
MSVVLRGYGKAKTTQKGGVVATLGYGRFKFGTFLRMRVLTRENRRAVGSQVEGRDV